MKKNYSLLVIGFLLSVVAYSQNTFPSTGSAGIGITSPNASSALEIKSTTQGILIPRMTKSKRDLIPLPAEGLMIYQTNSTPGFYYYNGSSWVAITSKGLNTSLSNLKAPTAINVSLIPGTDSLIDLGSVSNSWKDIYLKGNIFFHGKRFISNTGTLNTFTGENSGINNSGAGNAGFGAYTLYLNTAGSYNTANGYETLYSNTSGYKNTADGYLALYYNTTGHSNVAMGARALFKNTDRSNLVAIGDSALFNNGLNVGISDDATGNTAIGSKALYSNTSGGYNTADGFETLYSNVTGAFNTGDGYRSLYSNTTGLYNNAIGFRALNSNTTGNENTAVGDVALYSNTTGSYNTALGSGAGPSNSTQNLTNSTAIGYFATVDASNKVRIGNTTVNSIGGQVDWSSFSDGRYKKNIKENVKGLVFINSLRPITYTIDINGLNDYYNRGIRNDSTYEKRKKDIQPFTDEAAKIVYSGFIAQDVEDAAKKNNYDFNGVDKPQNKEGLYGLRYAEFVVPLVKAVQELSSKNDNMQSQNKNLQQQLNDLKTLVLSLQQTVQQCNSGQAKTIRQIANSEAQLEQNIPNPFNHTTTINYTLPQTYSSAKIIVVDNAGKVLKEINISGSSKGSLAIDASTFASGTYNYSLYINGKLIDTKQMLLTK